MLFTLICHCDFKISLEIQYLRVYTLFGISFKKAALWAFDWLASDIASIASSNYELGILLCPAASRIFFIAYRLDWWFATFWLFEFQFHTGGQLPLYAFDVCVSTLDMHIVRRKRCARLRCGKDPCPQFEGCGSTSSSSDMPTKRLTGSLTKKILSITVPLQLNSWVSSSTPRFNVSNRW